MVKKNWKKIKDWTTITVEITNSQVIYKYWFDPGKDPNKTTASLQDFNNQEHPIHKEINSEMGAHVLEEIRTSVSEILKNSN